MSRTTLRSNAALWALVVVVSTGYLACSGAPGDQAAPASVRDRSSTKATRNEPHATQPVSNRRPRRVDPRAGGFEIGLGEWALAPEADAIRPGEVTFVVENRGTMAHGFEIELEGDSSGPGSGDLFKAESSLLQPGESTRMTVTLARPGAYKIECLVDGHDDMGMEAILEVREDAPLVRTEKAVGPDEIAIADFAFAPASLDVSAGTEVTWSNDDTTDHTVTAVDGDFGSDALGQDQTFSHRFDQPGAYDYRCAIHPEMEGTVKVR